MRASEELDAAGAWDAVSARLRETLKASTFSAWFGQARPARLIDGRLEVAVPNEFTRSWITGRLAEQVAEAARAISADSVEFHVAADDQPPPPADETTPDPTRSGRRVEDRPAARPTSAVVTPPRDPGAPLNSKYTFDSFVIGSSNRFAHAAALAVAESPAQAYNPLFVYGATGLGKTHLQQAISHYIRTETPQLTAHYITSENFLNDFIQDLQEKRLENFKARYRQYDVLLVDDIQFFSGKERIQEEFFHTFNSLYETGAQIVLSSDRPPKDIPALEERLRSRFEWGLITDVQPPDLETRIAILRAKVQRDRLPAVPAAALETIAERVQTNIRELEGALTRCLAYASLNGVAVTSEVATEVLRAQYPADPRPVTAEEIQRVVADTFGVSIADLRSDRRTQAIVYPRQLAMYLCRELTDLSLPKIGQRFGGRDHTTVHYAQAKIARLLQEDRAAYNLVQDLTARLRRG